MKISELNDLCSCDDKFIWFPDPDDFISCSKRAHHATMSRLLSCLVNERLVENNVFQENIYGKGKIFASIFSPKNQFCYSNCKFIFQLIKAPTTLDDRKLKEGKKLLIKLLDPEECSPTVIMINSDDRIEKVNDPAKVWIEVSKWNEIDPALANYVQEQLVNSIHFQCQLYTSSKTMPNFESPAINWEQCLIENHPTHPMHRTRMAVPPMKPFPFSTDFFNHKLHFVAVPKTKVKTNGNYEKLMDDLINSFQGENFQLKEDEIIFPVLHLQLETVLETFRYARLLNPCLAAQGQASIRTVNIEGYKKLCYKLPMGVEITSNIRTLSPSKDFQGCFLAEVLDRVIVDKQLLIVAHDLCSSFSLEADHKKARHLGCIIREDPEYLVSDLGEKVMICAGLTEKNFEGVPNVVRVFELNTFEKKIKFFESYADKYLTAFMSPLNFGLAFEAHPQNTIARFDKVTKELNGFIFRDLGGLRIHEDTLKMKTDLCLDNILNPRMKQDNMDGILYLAAHCFFQNHLQILIRTLGLHYGLEGWKIVRDCLKRILPEDSPARDFFLGRKMVPLKCHLRMKLQNETANQIFDFNIPNMILFKPS